MKLYQIPRRMSIGNPWQKRARYYPAEALRLYSIGEHPTAFTKADAKADTEPNPQDLATSATLPPRSNSALALSSLSPVT